MEKSNNAFYKKYNTINLKNKEALYLASGKT